MKKYKIICDLCKHDIDINEVESDDYIHIEKEFGYFSNFDGEHHSIDICSRCYEEHIYLKVMQGR